MRKEKKETNGIIREQIHIDTIMRVLCALCYMILTVYSSSFSIVDESNRVPVNILVGKTEKRGVW